jgi:hypothetical protein
MKSFISISLAAFTFLCLLVASERRAWGYVDPGSGLLALQSFASVMAAGAYFLRRRIMGLFSRTPKENSGSDQSSAVMPINGRKPDNRNAA